MSYGQMQNASWKPESSSRGILVRIAWTIIAFIAGAGAVAMICAGLFADPQFEQVRLPQGETCHVNVVRFVVLAGAALLPFAPFAIWKAAHRGGFGFWRSTARPGLMTACSSLIGVGLASTACRLPAPLQMAGLSLAMVGSAGLLFFWILRGPAFGMLATDVYWNRALAVIFMFFAMGSSVGSVDIYNHWRHEGYQFNLNVPPYELRTFEQERWDWESRTMRPVERTVRLPRLAYNPQPIYAALLGFLAIGGLSESVYRMRLSRLARKAAFDRLF